MISRKRFERITSEPDVSIEELLRELDREIEETCFRIDALFAGVFVKLRKRGAISAEEMEEGLNVLRDIDCVDRETVENLFARKGA